MTNGDTLLVRIENAFQVSFDIVTAPSTDLTKTIQEFKAITISGFWQRLSYPD
jgi:hypothetical protein